MLQDHACRKSHSYHYIKFSPNCNQTFGENETLPHFALNLPVVGSIFRVHGDSKTAETAVKNVTNSIPAPFSPVSIGPPVGSCCPSNDLSP